jgi:hypothetical protein
VRCLRVYTRRIPAFAAVWKGGAGCQLHPSLAFTLGVEFQVNPQCRAAVC